MATGDQQDQDDSTEGADHVEVVETAPVTCSCEWATADTGVGFYSRIVKADPECQVHPPGWGWGL